MSDKFPQLHFIYILQIRISGRGIPGIFGTMPLHNLLILCFPDAKLSSLLLVPTLWLVSTQLHDLCSQCCAVSRPVPALMCALFSLNCQCLHHQPPLIAAFSLCQTEAMHHLPALAHLRPHRRNKNSFNCFPKSVSASRSKIQTGNTNSLSCSFKTLYLEIYQNCRLDHLLMLILLKKIIFKQGIKHFSAYVLWDQVFLSSYFYEINFSCSVFVKQLKSGCFSNV